MVLKNSFAGRQWRNGHREQTYGHGGGEEGEAEKYGESNMETYCSMCKIHCCCCSVTQSCLTLCDPMDCSTPGLPVPHRLLEFSQVHVHCIVGLPWWLSGKQSAHQCRRCKRRGFDPWVREIPWKRKWQPSPVFLFGKSHGQRSLVGCSPWVSKELVTKQQDAKWDVKCLLWC